MRLSNLHTHSTFSDGKNTVEDIARTAEEKQFVSLGFSDHSYTPCDESYCMMPDRYPAYFAAVKELKARYAGKMDILLGLEQDYYSEADPADYDYRIGSVHYICKNGVCYPIDHSLAQQQDCIAEICGGSRVDMAKRYFDLVVRHTERVRPDFVGHFDVITKFGLFDPDGTDQRARELEAYHAVACEALDEVMKTCRIFEMNTGAISRGVRTLPYPESYLLRRILAQGGEIVLSSDSHAAPTLDCFFTEGAAMLKGIGFDHVLIRLADGWHKESI